MLSAQDVLKLLKQDARIYQVKMLNEAEHAHVTGSSELQFAATTAAATVEMFVMWINKYDRHDPEARAILDQRKMQRDNEWLLRQIGTPTYLLSLEILGYLAAERLHRGEFMKPTQKSDPAATIGDIPSEPRQPASAALGHRAGSDTPSSVSTPAQDATALADRLECSENSILRLSGRALPMKLTAAERDMIAKALRATSQTPDAVTEITRLLTKIADLVDNEDAGEPLDDAIGYANKALALLSTASAGPQAEAVAWRWRYETVPEMEWQLLSRKPAEGSAALVVEPLYAHPHPQPQQADQAK